MVADIQELYVKAVEKAARSTVGVSPMSGLQWSHWGPQFRHGVGSGIVIDEQGHVLTAEHVVHECKKALVTLPDGRVVGAYLLGGDSESDIAVLKVESDGLVPAEISDPKEIRLGQPVLAIGNPLGLAGGPTVTSGVISSLHRSICSSNGNGLKVIQTDAAVNPGNSGGPIIDLKGRVVAIAAAQIPYAEGIGFALPIGSAMKLANEIIETGSVARPWLGIVGHELGPRAARYYGIPASKGVFIVDVPEGGPADNAGVRAGDVIHDIGGKQISDIEDLVGRLRELKIGESVRLEVERGRERRQVDVTIGARPT